MLSHPALSDPAVLRPAAAVLLGLLAVALLLWRRGALRAAELAHALDAARAQARLEAERLTHAREAAARELAAREAAEDAAMDAGEKAQGEALRAGRAEVLAEARAERVAALEAEARQLRAALDTAQEGLAGLERQLAETRLDARKDRESAAREVEALKALRQEMADQFRLMSSETLRLQGEGMEKRQGEQLAALLTPFRDQVHRFQTELQTRNEKTDEERARLREQIEYLHSRSEAISREAVALTRALKGDSQRQGAWGEMILGRILEESGLEAGIHYDLQVSQRDGEGRRWRPDCVVRMPQERVLVIDSKVSLLAYEEAANALDDTTRKAALARHVASLRAHVRDLSGKGYQQLEDGTVDYVLMFIPIEGAFSEALRADPALARDAIEARVGLATPTTLMLTLRTVDHIWTVDRRERNAAEIASRAGALYDKVAGFAESMTDVGRALERASDAHAEAMNRLTRGRGNVIRQVELLRELGARAQKRIELDSDDDDGASDAEDAGTRIEKPSTGGAEAGFGTASADPSPGRADPGLRALARGEG